ncbi:uncharacterized protein BYT42DRAFT_633761 [Radiomyces spectabilis]|uniref:uncharacterized protein n=1 Tax=Radiomyces spectabilis TaxID=64574 RepID=UPI0022206056|nr:uncharacterized protein BYT42DRAFT_633761 [Radiomyces spectabilis]KAI8384949.1 hypothetical protein BYT42DRAFT_633761 [Radiomyces spectabilis]
MSLKRLNVLLLLQRQTMTTIRQHGFLLGTAEANAFSFYKAYCDGGKDLVWQCDDTTFCVESMWLSSSLFVSQSSSHELTICVSPLVTINQAFKSQYQLSIIYHKTEDN